MNTLHNWWNSIVNYFSTLDEVDTKQLQEEVVKKTTKKVAKVAKKIDDVKTTASAAIKLINTAIDGETDSGKKKYKSRLSRELKKAMDTKDKIEVAKSVSRIVKYLNK